MARIVRPMRPDPADKKLPIIENSKKGLGVIETGKFPDVTVGPAGLVVLDKSGMSVCEDWRTLLGHRRPDHLDDEVNGSTGKGIRVFVHGSGPFAEGPITSELEVWFKPNDKAHGVVAPASAKTLADFRSDLASTQKDWVIDES